MPINKVDIDKLLIKYQATYNNFLNYYGSRVKKFAVPRKYHAQFLDINKNFEPEKAYAPLAQIMIFALENEAKILRVQGVVERLNQKDLEYLSIAVFDGITYLINNDLIFEQTIGSSISTPNFSFSSNVPSYMLSSDFLGELTKKAITNSEIKQYKLFETFEEAQVYIMNQNGIIQFLSGNIGGQ